MDKEDFIEILQNIVSTLNTIPNTKTRMNSSFKDSYELVSYAERTIDILKEQIEEEVNDTIF